MSHGPDRRLQIRNVEWFHMVNEHVIFKSSEHWSPQHLSSKVGARDGADAKAQDCLEAVGDRRDSGLGDLASRED